MGVRLLSGVCAVGSAVTLVLQGCGSAPPATSTAATSTAAPSPVAACLGGWNEGPECCCQNCPTISEGPSFNIQPTQSCQSDGGQCKPRLEVFGPDADLYLRPLPAAPAHRRLTERSAAGGSEQHHVIGGEPDEVTIVFVQPGEKTPLEVTIRIAGSAGQPTNQATTPSSYSFFISPMGWNGFAHSNRGYEYFPCVHENGRTNYQNTTCFYTSDIIHKARFTDLVANTAYEYSVQGEAEWRPFKTPPSVGSPIGIALVADLGQTTDSQTTMDHMKAGFDEGDFDIILFPGDLSYADGNAPLWDTYGRMTEVLFSAVPTAYGVGNHDSTSGFENNVNFLPRYGWESSKTTSSSPLWYSYEAGLAHVIMLCSYCDTRAGTAQYVWLQRDLDAVNRTRTPWVVMAWHVPFYTSSKTHPMEGPHADGDKQRANLEHLVYAAKVDVVFQGHLHSYERTQPVFNNETTCDGPVYITIGDGGNHEGPACGWLEFPWSVKKETSFGYGVLKISNATDAEWLWHRNQDAMPIVGDSAPLKTSATRCSSPAPVTSAPVTPVTAVTV